MDLFIFLQRLIRAHQVLAEMAEFAPKLTTVTTRVLVSLDGLAATANKVVKCLALACLSNG